MCVYVHGVGLGMHAYARPCSLYFIGFLEKHFKHRMSVFQKSVLRYFTLKTPPCGSLSSHGRMARTFIVPEILSVGGAFNFGDMIS